jgi:TPR repeat protein
MRLRFYARPVAAFGAIAGFMLVAAPALAADPVEKEPSRLEQLDQLRLDCATGAGEACYELARDYEPRKDYWGQPVAGDGLRRDDKKAVYYFRKSCDLGVKEGCQNLGRMYEAGKGVVSDAR